MVLLIPKLSLHSRRFSIQPFIRLLLETSSNLHPRRTIQFQRTPRRARVPPPTRPTIHRIRRQTRPYLTQRNQTTMAYTHRTIPTLLRRSHSPVSSRQLQTIPIPLPRPHNLRNGRRKRYPHVEHPRLHTHPRALRLRPHQIQNHRNLLRARQTPSFTSSPKRNVERPFFKSGNYQ